MGLIKVKMIKLSQVPRPTHSLVHTTLASSACTQSCWPTGLLEHWKRVLSVPKQATLSSQIGPGGEIGVWGWGVGGVIVMALTAVSCLIN